MTQLTIVASPHTVKWRLEETALLVIDMQKDFLYPEGYGALLGNDTSLLLSTVGPIQAVLTAARAICCWTTSMPSSIW